MSELKTIRELPPLRHAIVEVDAAIVDARHNIAEADASLRLDHPELSESLYDAPSYNADIYPQLGIAAQTLTTFTERLVSVENLRADILSTASPVHAALLTRIPDMTWYRTEKPSYRQVAIDTSDPRHLEPVVSLSDYGVGSRSYYSRPNNATGEAVPGVKPEVFVRLSLAEKLAWINERLSSPEITAFFGGEVELFVEEGWRDPRLQQYLHHTVIPKLIRAELSAQHPELDVEELEEMVTKERDRKIAWSPATESDSPPPHQTGAAGDLTLRYVDTKERIYFGRGPAQMVNRTDPDNFEHNPPQTPEDQLAAQNLYALYAIMRGTAFDTDTGLVPNPTEFWHWSVGDQLNYIVSGVQPYYGFAPMDGVSTYEPQD